MQVTQKPGKAGCLTEQSKIGGLLGDLPNASEFQFCIYNNACISSIRSGGAVFRENAL